MPTAAKDKQKDKQKDEQDKALQTMEKGDHNPFVHGLLTQAQELRDEKEALFHTVSKNRETLRAVRDTGFLSDEQAKAIEEWYPTPKRTKKDENGTTEAAAGADEKDEKDEKDAAPATSAAA